MRSPERTVVYSLLTFTLVAVVVGRFASNSASAARAAPAVPAAPDPAKIATCDVYQLMEVMTQPALDAEQNRLKAELAPLEKELDALQTELKAAKPEDPAAQQKFRVYQTKGEEYKAKTQSLAEPYDAFVVSQYSDAYQKVLAEARKAAAASGYNFVIAQKRGEIKAREPHQLVEEFLSRPAIVAPADVDVTETVRIALKLPEKPATPPAADKPGSPAPEKPAAPAPDQPKK